MKLRRDVLYLVALAAALAGFGWFFVTQLRSGSGGGDELAGVLLSPPPGYSPVERGELTAPAAAAELEAQALRPGAGKVGLHFRRQGAEVYWLADVAGNQLEERAAGASGTRLQTVWSGGLRERLAWARTRGTFDAPGLPPGERKNLYH
jgi:hypothetical protein